MRCPKCRSLDVRLSHRRNPLERCLSLFALRPFRCLDCNVRFWRFRTKRKLLHRKGPEGEEET